MLIGKNMWLRSDVVVIEDRRGRTAYGAIVEINSMEKMVVSTIVQRRASTRL